jgi:pimeloyl-ACP methyl ester carboxylesterase
LPVAAHGLRILYLHGFASGPGSKKAAFFRDRLHEQGLDLEVPDLARGDFERLTITGQLAAVEQAAGGETISLIGSSLGGYLAALYAARRPVRHLVLLAPAFGFAHRWAESLGAKKIEEWKRTGALEIYHYGEYRPRQLGYQLLEDASRYEDYPRFSQPALIFHGKRDETVPARYSAEFASGRENVRLELLDSDHELLDALDEIWRQAGPFLLE